MRQKPILGVCCCLAGLSAYAVAADTAGTAQQNQRSGQHSVQSGQTGQKEHSVAKSETHKDASAKSKGEFKLMRASKVIDQKVKNPQGADLGDIQELAVDINSGRVAYAVLDFGGFLGIGNKFFAVPFNALTQHHKAEGARTDDDTLVLNVDKQRLENAPGFDQKHWPDMANQRWATDVHAYYNQRPYWETDTTPGARLEGEPIARSPEREADRTSPGTESKDKERHIMRAEADIIGASILAQDNATIGDVHDLLVDRNSGKVSFVVVEFDDADKVSDDKKKNLAAIPWKATSPTMERGLLGGRNVAFKMNVGLDKVKGHTFSEDSYPNLADRQWASSTYSAYGQTPVWEKDSTRSPDLDRDVDRQRQQNQQRQQQENR